VLYLSAIWLAYLGCDVQVMSKALVFKAFNTLGAEIMSDPVIGAKRSPCSTLARGTTPPAEELPRRFVVGLLLLVLHHEKPPPEIHCS